MNLIGKELNSGRHNSIKKIINMKKRILILHFNMELGGVESSLLGLLDAIDFDKHDVDLFLYAQEGDLLPLINSHVNILPELKQYRALTQSIKQNFKSKLYGIACMRMFARMRSKLSNGPLNIAHNYKQYFHKLCIPYLPDISGRYDLAISFNDPHFIIGKKVNARVKASWFHTDASRVKFCDEIEKEMWELSDYVVNVSDDCKEAFDKKHSYLTNNSVIIENILSRQFILNRSREFSVKREMPDDGRIKLLSIGRFTAPKNFDNVPDICKKILSLGVNVRWYLIGYGGDESLIHEKIRESGMQEHVIIIGKRANPYPYIKECDAYVQPSRYEGKCVAVREAQILEKPVIITRYATSSSQLEEGVDGIIVPMDNEGCAKEIVKLLNNPKKMKQLSQNCSKRDYTNAQEIEKIYRMLEEQ